MEQCTHSGWRTSQTQEGVCSASSRSQRTLRLDFALAAKWIIRELLRPDVDVSFFKDADGYSYGRRGVLSSARSRAKGRVGGKLESESTCEGSTDRAMNHSREETKEQAGSYVLDDLIVPLVRISIHSCCTDSPSKVEENFDNDLWIRDLQSKAWWIGTKLSNNDAHRSVSLTGRIIEHLDLTHQTVEGNNDTISLHTKFIEPDTKN